MGGVGNESMREASFKRHGTYAKVAAIHEPLGALMEVASADHIQLPGSGFAVPTLRCLAPNQ